MPYDPAAHHRRSIRLPGYDYSQPGWYFITACATRKRPVFGLLDGTGVTLNICGAFVRDAWLALPKRFAHVATGDYIVMPDHFHGLLQLLPRDADAEPCEPLGKIVAYFEYNTTSAINSWRAERHGAAPAQVWQRNFYEHIVRDEQEHEAFRFYMAENPRRAQLAQE